MNQHKPTRMDVHEQVLAAEKRIRPYIRKTDLEYSPYLSGCTGGHVYLKLESRQHTGSFKYRGALNKFLSLSSKERQGPVITASSGNHGTAFAAILQRFGGRGVVYLPENASPAKVNNLQQYGVDLEFFGSDCVMSETLAKKTAEKNRQVFISPYNDLQIIGGQGTIALELLDQLNSMDTVLVPVGGGGLISGIAGYLKAMDENINVIGCQPENSAVMYASIKAGKIIDMASKPTIADGTAGGIEPDSKTFDICRDTVDDYILVSEGDIKAAILRMIQQHQILIEGAAALSVACLLKEKNRFNGKNTVLIISGKKITVELLKEILNEI
ncbi:MAG: threonine/serine dehydratase [Deltaproteobacteria bacterium]|jgi:threonine dehydratase|nr:threonine/serine dehydratase [Deltaproteobacteria bacterium]